MTQNEAVLEYIRDKGSITSIQAISDLGVTRLAARIADLRKMGHSLKATSVYVTNRYGKAVRCCKYEEDKE